MIKETSVSNVNLENGKNICDFDCFNCRFEDCINDRLEIEDYIAGENLDRSIITQRGQKKARKLSAQAIKSKKEYHSSDVEGKRAYARAYYSLNRERLKKYRLENKERKSAYDRRYFEKNREKICERNKVKGLKNKKHLRERQKEWREKNRDKIREYQRQYYLKRKLEKAEK